jgi:feruloyl esterase
VQRYPRDYDGVIAGAPGVNTPEMSARRMWEMQRHSQWGRAVPPSVWKLVTRSAIAQCDDDDGVRDGVVADPRQCRFDPARLLCKSGETGAGCLSPLQIDAVRTIYAPLYDENGKRIDQGLLWTAPVSPAPLPEPFTPGPSYLATVLFADGVHADPAWDARQFSLARDLPAIDRLMNLHADNPAIEPFTRAGGKLILYHGWDDPLVSARSTLGYWDALSARFGSRLDDSVRLFMVPEVDPRHDLLSALEEWVLRGKAPETVIATKPPAYGAPERTQLLCVWPARAMWNGSGATASATSYFCRKD